MMNCSPSRLTGVSIKHGFCTNLVATLFLAALLAFPASAQQQEWPKDQTTDLMALRISTSPAEKKLSFNLFLLSRSARHASLGTFASLMDSRSVNSDGTVNVEIVAYLSPSLLASRVMTRVVEKNGSIPLPAYISDHLQARVTEAQLLDLAANPNVLSIRDAAADSASSSMSAANHLPEMFAAH